MLQVRLRTVKFLSNPIAKRSRLLSRSALGEPIVGPRFQFGPLLLDAAQRAVRKGNQSLHLTPREFEILLYLLENSDRVVSREELLTKLWRGVVVEEANLTQNVFLLRKVLGLTSTGQPFIETVPKRGYRIAVPVRRQLPLGRWVLRALLLAGVTAWSVLCYWLGYWLSR